MRAGALLWLTLAFSLWAQSRSNFDILMAQYDRYLHRLFEFPVLQQCSSITLRTTEHPAALILKNRFLHRALGNTLSATSQTPCTIELSIEHFEVSYYAHPDPDSVVCLFRWTIFPVLYTGTTSHLLPPLDTSVRLTYTRSEIPLREQPRYPFTTAPLPPAVTENLFWSRYGEPLLFLTSSLLAVLLFFTLRSQ